MQAIEAPVLFITFNRPDTTSLVFEAIRKAKPEKLYIFSDGPRNDRYEDDLSKISENRKLAEKVDWNCSLQTRFMEKNQGCGVGVSGAISWVLQQEDRVIILEDDCVPSLSFFHFCNELLQRYENDTRFMSISGTRWNEEFPIENCDYFYTRFAHIWGWATWRRAWQLYDYNMKDWPLFKEKKILNMVEEENAPLIKRWAFLFNNIYNLDKKHTWDYQWQYAIYKNNGLCINSVKNLVTNIGLDGMHTSTETEEHNRERHELNGELQSPPFPFPEYGFDTYHGRKFFLKDRSDLKVLYDQATSKIGFLNK